MVRLIGVGDNTVDTYINQGMMFPGGNAVNVPVLARRYGHETSYIGCLGNDFRGKLILKALKEEKVDVSHVKIIEGPNAWCEVYLVDNDRVFGNSTKGVVKRLILTGDDFDFIKRHDITHTSIFSYIETQLPRLSKASNHISFDYSSKWTTEYLEKTLPWVDIAILSYPIKLLSKVKNFLNWIHKQGPSLVILTLGAEGSIAFDGSAVYTQGIVKTEVIDTLGAGDAFIARFLVEHLSGTPIQDSLEKAAVSGAETCGYYGGFGHGIPIDSTKV